MIRIDGAMGEGGGQILRSALTLSLLTQQSFEIYHLRARRRKPGLRPQHLTAVSAAGRISKAQITGAEIGSLAISFSPQDVAAGEYAFSIETAGATTLVLQTILLPLAVCKSPSQVSIHGGTHVPWSPCAEYLMHAWLPALRKIGFQASIQYERAGFFPRGGGSLKASICKKASLNPVAWTERGPLVGLSIISAAAKLPGVPERQIGQAQSRLQSWGVSLNSRIAAIEALDRGSFLFIQPAFERGIACFFGLGERGKPAEKVADEAIDQLERFLNTDAALDPFLADQILIPLALAPSASSFSTSLVTDHLLTNAAVVEAFGIAEIQIQGLPGQPGNIRVLPQKVD